MNHRILIVEDDLTLAANLYTYLEALGYVPDAAYDGAAALAMAQQHAFDAIVLDVGLPCLDGLRVLRALRQDTGSSVPVLLLTARDTLEDKLSGFSHGADDYMTKPFALAELAARLSALIARSHGAVVPGLKVCGNLVLDARTQVVTVNGKPVHLTRKSVQILALLLRDAGGVLSRSALEHALWAGDPPSSDALRSQMHLLRRALSEAGFNGIQTAHGVGWRLVAGVDEK